MKPRLDLSLYLVTDSTLTLGRPLDSVVQSALAGGVTTLQVREKSLATGPFVDLVRRLKKITAPAGVPLIVNDRVDVALAAGADGVHVGQSDMSVDDARRLLGPAAIIGLSVETPDDVVAAALLPVDFLGVSPIFDTPTKRDTASAWGVAGLAAIRPLTRLPLVAIGGIKSDNAAEILAAGADGLAIVSAICADPDPRAAAACFKTIIRKQLPSGSHQRSTP